MTTIILSSTIISRLHSVAVQEWEDASRIGENLLPVRVLLALQNRSSAANFALQSRFEYTILRTSVKWKDRPYGKDNWKYQEDHQTHNIIHRCACEEDGRE